MPERPDEYLRLTDEERRARQRWFAEQKRRQPPPGPLPTMAQTRATHYWLWVHCTNTCCNRHVALPITPLLIRWGDDASNDMLRTSLRCVACGHKGVTLTHAG